MTIKSVMAVALATVGALVGPSLAGTSRANAAACVAAPVATYTAAGFSCNVDGVTFSSINVTPGVTGNGSVALGNFIPFTAVVNGAAENGLTLTYTASASGPVQSTADVAWTYSVSGSLLTDAYASLTGNTITGNGSAAVVVNETLSNGSSLTLNAPGSTSVTFAPIGSLAVIKDQQDFALGTGAIALSSAVTNAFSLTTTPVPVPEPATLAILGVALLGTGLIRRRRS